MEKPVILSIRGTQSIEPGQEEVMELVTQGILKGEEGNYFVTYEESKLTGLEGTTTTFHLEKDRITLLREGSLRSEMIFKVGEKHLAPYETPYGSIFLGVNTQKAVSDVNENGGHISIRYIMEVENQVVGENTFEVQVSEPTH